MNTFLLINAYISGWMLIPFGIIWLIVKLTKPDYKPQDKKMEFDKDGLCKTDYVTYRKDDDGTIGVVVEQDDN
jgi:hypothetical protein